MPYERSSATATAAAPCSSSGIVPGGYGWVFPKGDHANIGIGGWEREDRACASSLRKLCAAHGVAATTWRRPRLPACRCARRARRSRAAGRP